MIKTGWTQGAMHRPSMNGTPERPPRRRYLYVLAMVGLAGAAALLAYRYLPVSGPGEAGAAPDGAETAHGHGGRGGAAGRPVSVAAEPARTGDLPVYLNGLGTVTPRASVTVRSRVDGELMRIGFQEGQTVRAGDLLAEIDPRPFQVQLLQAQGALARDRALLANARVDLERYRTLYQQDSGSKQQWDTQKALVEQYEGALKTDEAQIESARLQLDYARIRAPIGGRVGLRQLDPGNMVHAADANGLVVINEVRPIAVLFTLPADEVPRVLARLRDAQRPPVEAWDRTQKTRLATGTLVTLDNQIDPATGTVRLKAEFPNEDEALFPNQFVNVRLLVEVLHGATLIPTAALQHGTQGTFVYLVQDDQRVVVRPVRLGPTQGETVAVTDGLKAGDGVVTDGSDKLRDGARVRVGGAPGEEGPAAGQAQHHGGRHGADPAAASGPGGGPTAQPAADRGPPGPPRPAP